MNYNTVMNKIEAIIQRKSGMKKRRTSDKGGIMAPKTERSMPSKEKMPVEEQLAEYIMAIREGKKKMMESKE